MPFYKKVPITHRVRRFQLGKLAIMLQEIKDEEEAALRSTAAADDAIDASLPAAPEQSPPVEDQENPIDDPLET
eukprot:373548-Amphidinium_carterae.1